MDMKDAAKGRHCPRAGASSPSRDANQSLCLVVLSMLRHFALRGQRDERRASRLARQFRGGRVATY